MPIPQYLFSLQSGGNFVLLWLLVTMCRMAARSEPRFLHVYRILLYCDETSRWCIMPVSICCARTLSISPGMCATTHCMQDCPTWVFSAKTRQQRSQGAPFNARHAQACINRTQSQEAAKHNILQACVRLWPCNKLCARLQVSRMKRPTCKFFTYQ